MYFRRPSKLVKEIEKFREFVLYDCQTIDIPVRGKALSLAVF